MATTIASLMVDIGANVAHLQKDLNAASGQIKTFTNDVKGTFKGLGATLAAYFSVTQAFDVVKLSGQFDQAKAAFQALAASYNTSGEQVLSALKKASAGTVSNFTLMQKAGTAMMMGIDPTKLNKLMEIARATSKMTGQEVSQAFSDIALAVGRQSKMILDNLGIIVSLEKAYDDYAKQINKAKNQLTDADKKQAFLNATIKEGDALIDRLGKQTKSASDIIANFGAVCETVKIWIGKGITIAIREVALAFNLVGTTVNATLEIITQGWANIFQLIGQIPWVGENLGFKVWGEGLQALADHFRVAREEGNKFTNDVIDSFLPPTQPKPWNRVTDDGATGIDPKKAKKAADDYKQIYRDLQKDIRALNLDEVANQKALIEDRIAEIRKSDAYLLASAQRRAEMEKAIEEWKTAKIEDIRKQAADKVAKEVAGMKDLWQVHYEDRADIQARTLELMADKEKSFVEEVKSAVEGWASNFSQTLNDVVWNAESSFNNIFQSFAQMLTQMMIQKKLVEPFLNWGLNLDWSTIFSAKGNVFGPSGLVPFGQGGVVTRPTIFPFAKGIGVMGEAGDEAIMPLTRTPGGDLGVKAMGGSVEVTVNNYSGAAVDVQQGRTANGGRDIRIMIGEAVASDIRKGGSVHQTLRKTFGLQPTLAGR